MTGKCELCEGGQVGHAPNGLLLTAGLQAVQRATLRTPGQGLVPGQQVFKASLCPGFGNGEKKKVIPKEIPGVY